MKNRSSLGWRCSGVDK